MTQLGFVVWSLLMAIPAFFYGWYSATTPPPVVTINLPAPDELVFTDDPDAR